MGLSLNQISSGMALLVEGELYWVVEAQHVKPGKGSAFLKARLKNIKTDQVFERTIRSVDKFEEAVLEEKALQNLYQSGEIYHFMDHTTYEEITIPKEILGDAVRFLQDNLEVTGLFYNNKLLKVVLPTFITVQITHTEPGFKGDSTRAGTKPAVIDTGAMVQVPLFINIGDVVKIDTRTGQYVERVQK